MSSGPPWDLDPDARRAWLVKHQPLGVAERPNWWLWVLETPKSHITRSADLDTALRWFSVACEVLDTVEDLGLLSEWDHTLLERAYLVGSLIDRFGAPQLPDWVGAPDLVRQVLARLGDRHEAERMAVDWTERPLDDIRRLRRQRNLCRPLRWLRHAVTDPATLAIVDDWIATAAKLP